MTIDGPPAHTCEDVSIGQLIRWMDRQTTKCVRDGKRTEASSMAEAAQAIEISYWMYWQDQQEP